MEKEEIKEKITKIVNFLLKNNKPRKDDLFIFFQYCKFPYPANYVRSFKNKKRIDPLLIAYVELLLLVINSNQDILEKIRNQ